MNMFIVCIHKRKSRVEFRNETVTVMYVTKNYMTRGRYFSSGMSFFYKDVLNVDFIVSHKQFSLFILDQKKDNIHSYIDLF